MRGAEGVVNRLTLHSTIITQAPSICTPVVAIMQEYNIVSIYERRAVCDLLVAVSSRYWHTPCRSNR